MKRHSTDLVSLVFGLIFLGAAGWWVAGRFVNIDVPHAGWIAAGVLIGLGVLGLLGSLRGEKPEPVSSGATPVSTGATPTSAPTVQMTPVPPTTQPDETDEDDGPRDAPSTDIR